MVHPVGLDLCIMTGNHHYNIIRNNFSALKSSVFCLFIPLIKLNEGKPYKTEVRKPEVGALKHIPSMKIPIERDVACISGGM